MAGFAAEHATFEVDAKIPAELADGTKGHFKPSSFAEGIGLGPSDSPQFTGIELGHATDTTLSRVAAGRAAIEGNDIALAPDMAVFAKRYGVVADGVTDDTANLQLAVTAAAGKTLILPAGTILLSGATAGNAITLPAAGIRIVGAGKHNTVLRVANTTACSLLTAIDADNIEIEGVGFDGQSTARLAWQRAFVFRGCRKVRVHNCWFYRMGDSGVGLVGTTGFGGSDAYGEGTRQTERYVCTDNLVEDCWGTVAIIMKFVGAKDVIISRNTVKNSTTIAISVESEGSTTEYAERVVVTDNIIETCDYAHSSGASAVAYAISIGERSRNVVCSGNIVDGVAGDTIAAGILISTSPSQDDTEAINIVVSGNTIRTIAGATGRAFGVLLQAGDTSIGRIAITGNTIDAAEDGIGLDVDAGADTLGRVDNITISGNTITNCTEFGIQSLTVSSSGSLPSRGVSITGNVIDGATSHGMTLHLTDSVIAGNTVRNCGGVGIALATGCARLSVTGNLISNNNDSGISAVATASVFSGNVCMNNGQTAGTGYGIYLTGGSNCIVNGNTLSDDQGSPTQDYGFRGPATTKFFDNDCLGNASGAIFGGITSINTGQFDIAHNRTSVTGPIFGLASAWRVIANSGVAVSHTGDLIETTLATVSIPAGAMGANGMIRVWALYSWTNSGNNKTPRIRFGGTGGTIYHGFNATTTNGEQAMVIIRNRNSASSQVGQIAGFAGLGNLTSAPVTSAVDTSAAVDLVLRGTLASAGETITLEGYTVEVLYGA